MGVEPAHMADHDDNSFRIKPGRPRSRGGPASLYSKPFITQVKIAVRKAGGNPNRIGGESGNGSGRFNARGRGAKLAPSFQKDGGGWTRDGSGTRFRSRRVVVKARVVKFGPQRGQSRGSKFRSTSAKAVDAHLRYLERDGVTKDGEKGRVYSAVEDEADGKAFVERGRDDRHQFRFIVAPEDAADMADMRSFTRDLMKQMEQDLDTRLDWIAVDHHNTGHPHTHVIVRGVLEDGRILTIAGDYIALGVRHRAEALVTLELGQQNELEIAEKLRHEVVAERLTRLDRMLIAESREQGIIDLRPDASDSYTVRANRALMDEGFVGGEGFAVDGSLIKADANRQSGIEGSTWTVPEKANRAVKEYVAALDDAAFGSATTVTPKFVSPADPAARWTAANGGLAFFAYTANYMIDLDHAIIVDVEATTAIRQGEVTAAKRMIERTREMLDLYPERLAADSGYGSAEMLGWLVHEQGIEPHIPVFDKSGRTDGTFSRKDFTWDQQDDAYRCPAGKVLKTSGTIVNDNQLMYRASKRDCEVCELKGKCCPKEPARKVPRSIHEGARDMARDIAKTEAYVTSRRQRKKVEMLFAHLKRILKLDRLRLRGPNGARDEFHLAATAQNLRKLAKLIPVTAPEPA